MKPLELTIYPKPNCDPDACQDWHVCDLPTLNIGFKQKRFSDAELATEYYAACIRSLLAEYEDGADDPDIEAEHANTLHRFATHPHYSDAD